MTWAKKILAPIALATGLGFAAMAFARTSGDNGYDEQDPQPEQKKVFDKKGFDRKTPFGGGFEKKADPKADPQPERRGGQPAPRGERGERSDPAVDGWVGVLIEKITDPHDTIRDSARGALVGVGRPAVPALERLANGNDGAKAVAAKKIIAMIEHTSGRGPMAGPPMDRGRGDGERGGRGGEGDRGRGGEGDRGPGRPGFPGAGGPPGFGPGGGRGPGGPMGPGATPPGGRPGAGPMGPGRPGEAPAPRPVRPGGRGPGEGRDEIPPIRPA
ncbi:MAG TPA: hypothetical protein VMZ71_04075 [Gemmataceae bacterium]|nr:hypothetical protein [Gemmataceae bacterium]